MTSNIGSEEFAKKQTTIGFATDSEDKIKDKAFEDIKTRIMAEVKDFMLPELLNRLDYISIFRPLSQEVLVSIFEKELKDFLAVWKEKTDLDLPKFTKKKIVSIIKDIYDPQYGARPISRYIHDTIEPDLIQKVMDS